jgi:sialate O-acetylesterase
LWYQGEFNIGDGPLYTPKQNLLFACWRKFWQDEHLPVYFVQLPRHIGGIFRPGVSDKRARFQEVQAASVAPPYTHMVVAFDLGDTNDGNHPSNKADVGRRMAALMLRYTYGREDIPAHGPTYRSHKVVDGKMVIQFDHVGKGLMLAEKPMKDGRVTKDPAVETPNAKPGHLAICGEDRAWFWAEARIEKDALMVWSPKVPAPMAVRYAFNVWPQGANLYNRDGLPMSPFRTDDWPQNDEARHYMRDGKHETSECGRCATFQPPEPVTGGMK